MSYIKTREHFINYLKRALKDSSIGPEELLPAEFYIQHIYACGDGDSFAWDLKEQGPELLLEANVLKWLCKQEEELFLTPRKWEQIFTEEFVDLCGDLMYCQGVYSFWNKDGACLYVGRSTTSLGERMVTSFRRLSKYDREVYLRYMVTKNAADAMLIEVYFINTIKPPLNKKDRGIAELTVTVEPLPSWSEPLLISTIKREK